jgi:hypothetical protein
MHDASLHAFSVDKWLILYDYVHITSEENKVCRISRGSYYAVRVSLQFKLAFIFKHKTFQIKQGNVYEN